MTIEIRDDVVYIILNKVKECDRAPGPDKVRFTAADFAGMELTPADLLGHLDYLHQEHYIHAEFTGNAYATQEDVPDFVNPQEFEMRIANTLGAPDGPLPHLIEFDKAELTDKGQQMLEEMQAKPPQNLKQGQSVPILGKDEDFLRKVMIRGELPDIYDARDITEVVFRVMRDLMTEDTIEHVTEELHEPVLHTDKKALQIEIADLWEDTNPLVRLISHIRQPLRGPAPIGIDDNLFLTRVATEGGLPSTTNSEEVIRAVFAATRDELSPERVAEVSQCLPGDIRRFWDEA